MKMWGMKRGNGSGWRLRGYSFVAVISTNGRAISNSNKQPVRYNIYERIRTPPHPSNQPNRNEETKLRPTPMHLPKTNADRHPPDKNNTLSYQCWQQCRCLRLPCFCHCCRCCNQFIPWPPPDHPLLLCELHGAPVGGIGLVVLICVSSAIFKPVE